MKFLIAETAGFCMGVKRAVDLALEHGTKAPGGVFTLGPLIHNNQTIEMLRERRVVTLDDRTSVPADATVLIRAHGVPPQLEQSWTKKSHVIDGTCPKVKTVHRVIEKYRNFGYSIIITGDKGHAEVIGLQGYAKDSGILIDKPQDVDTLPSLDKICLVSQTTFDNETFDAIAERVRRRYSNKEVVIKKTICSATDKRQSETRDLAKRVDAMIVVGGKNSANTMRLESIARECGAATQWVETESEIDWDKLASCKTVGITAGASTPNWMIKRIVEYLMFMDQTKKKTPTNRVRQAIDLLSTLNVLVSSGAAMVYFASCVLQAIEPTISGAAIAFLYFLSMYLWNSLTSMESTQHLSIGRYQFYSKYKPQLYVVVGVCMAGLLAISLMQSKFLFYLMLFATFAGSVYHITIIPKFLKVLFRYSRLKDIPTLRDLFVALAWGIVLTFMPAAQAEIPAHPLSIAVCFIIIFVLGYMRSLIFDLRDIEGDRIMGRETLVTFIGEARVRKAILMLTMLTGFLCIITPFVLPFFTLQGNSNRFFLLILPFVYLCIFILVNRGNKVSRLVYFNILADAPFFLAGIAAFAAHSLL